MVILYDFNLSRGHMTRSQSRAMLCLLHKGGPTDSHANYRPLTMLNTSAKLGPSILAYRTNYVLPQLLHQDQYGFTPGRSIHNAITRLQDLQRHCQTTGNHQAGAIMCDFAKAFDSVSRPALDIILQHFGFGPVFRRQVATFFEATQVSIIFNNAPLAPFTLGTGVRQGDPISPALFVIFIEPLLNEIRHKMAPFALRTLDVDHCSIAFADDLTGIVSDLSHAPRFLDTVSEFCAATGMHLNMSKTSILPFSVGLEVNTRQLITVPGGPKVLAEDEVCKWLGTTQGTTCTDHLRTASLVAKVAARCNLWRYRARTLHGRSTLAQTIILPLLWYTMAVVHIPDAVLNPITQLVQAFVQGKGNSIGSVKNHLNKAWLTVPNIQGGLQVPDLIDMRSAYSLRSIVNMLKALDSMEGQGTHWMTPALCLFTQALQGKGSGLDILYLELPHAFSRTSAWLTSQVGPFWFHALRTWSNKMLPLHDHNDCPTTLYSTPLWIAPAFRFGVGRTQLANTSVFSSQLYHFGLHTLQDLVDEYGHWPTEDELTTTLRFLEPDKRPNDCRLGARGILSKLVSWLPIPFAPGRPPQPREYRSGYNNWSFKFDQGRTNLSEISFQLLYRLCHKITVPPLALDRLEIRDEVPGTIWREERLRDRHLLPVLRDFKYRLQHNALGCLYRYTWRTDVITSLDCRLCTTRTIETPKHLLWDCDFARAIWCHLLGPLTSFLDRELDWRDIVFFDRVSINVQYRVASKALLYAANVVRCVGLRMIWLHRNHVLYNHDAVANKLKVLIPAHEQIRLHWVSYLRYNELLQLPPAASDAISMLTTSYVAAGPDVVQD